jgi:hypothetical protein
MCLHQKNVEKDMTKNKVRLLDTFLSQVSFKQSKSKNMNWFGLQFTRDFLRQQKFATLVQNLKLSKYCYIF